MAMTADGDQLRSSGAKSLFNEVLQLHRDGELDKAWTIYRRYLAIVPQHAQAWTNYGVLLRSKGLFAAAIAAHRRSLELDPDTITARNNLANALSDNAEYAEAAELRRRILEQIPQTARCLGDLCAALRGLDRHDEVIRLVDEAEAEGWADGACYLQRGLSRLMLGDYGPGFTDFEHRYSGDEVRLPEATPWPRWQGEALEGKRLLVLPEQGFGDAIVMARFLPGLKQMGGEVHMVVKPPLHRLFGELDGVDHISGSVQRTDPFDFYTPNISLPHLVGLPGDQPPPAPQLAIPESSRSRAASIVAPFSDRFRIGIVWTGSLTFRANHRRSTRPEAFLGLASVPGVQLFSLYKGAAQSELITSGAAGIIVDACASDRDFADTAAVIDEMDLLITTDTAVVHIGASLGKPVWNLLCHEGFWLYGLGDTTPWYPSMRLFRQREHGDWDELFERVEHELHTLLKERQ